ncbi:uncharacterized protein LOC110226629 [Arabidopsis lyrata subsp. lyrata]|uniref:uncharacterized protein LOC110226629 n=1 Tax=Arabidopsis lyrata subsp. lyrata TaxID=81972 RepID=UPI000A29B477|nr:uncharacterized protein LOC110226629 [Arabidopsis lyrata subsp. lyrata]XP_020874425.1 uncharacterized protein LOC110226629 [Arabidopsis lyrata subsp. lyrata]|eukprot:XP_020874420.1 uncharacterized protein LOC110226629 [Arabidopsis lyrata subsp. lyrata]
MTRQKHLASRSPRKKPPNSIEPSGEMSASAEQLKAKSKGKSKARSKQKTPEVAAKDKDDGGTTACSIRRPKSRRVAAKDKDDTEPEACSIRPPKSRRVPANDKDETDGESLSGDDCEVGGDEDLDEVRYPDEQNGNQLGVVEEECHDFEEHFGEAARDEGDVSDADSGDDIWDEDRIPDPFSDSDHDEDEVEAETGEQQPEDPEVLRKLGHTYSSPEEFKIAVLRYSLKTRYDIKLYKSQSLKVGAKCSDTDVKCGWRCYCSYDKKKHKMQIKVYEDNHICVRSGYSKMLKRGTIAWLFSERLRKNPKITKYEMVAEIQREYNLTVTEEQCSKAKTKVMRERKAIHEDHFSKIWDYQAEIFRSNSGTIFEIETILGPTIGSLQRFSRLFICFKSQKSLGNIHVGLY